MSKSPVEESLSGAETGRLNAWLPTLLVVGGFWLSWLPSHNAMLNAALVDWTAC